jgi:alpha-1,2-mannosyltransferase
LDFTAPGRCSHISIFSAQIENATPSIPPGKAIDDLYAKLTVGAAVFFVTLEIAVFVHAGWPPAGKPSLDAEHHVFGRDFINTWMGGRSIFSGGPAPWFDFRVYNEAIRRVMGQDFQLVFWSYPPHAALFAWPFDLLPYFPAYLAWCAIGIAVCLFVAKQAVPQERTLSLAAPPAIAVCVFFGQNGFYTAALLIGSR